MEILEILESPSLRCSVLTVWLGLKVPETALDSQLLEMVLLVCDISLTVVTSFLPWFVLLHYPLPAFACAVHLVVMFSSSLSLISGLLCLCIV